MSNTITIYPSTIIEAVEAAKLRNTKDIHGFSAFRIVVDGSKVKQGDLVTYYPFEVNVKSGDGTFKWAPVSLMGINLTHVGRIEPLIGEKSRMAKKILNVSVLFKGDYVYSRIGSGRHQITEEYGKAKRIISDAFVAHAKIHKSKGVFSPQSTIIPNVKTTRQVKKDGKYVTETVDPANINVGLKFAGKTSKDQQESPDTLFQCTILDAGRPKEKTSQGEWPFHEAALQDGNGEYSIPVNNGNIHLFLKGGSLVTGIENMSSVCASQGKLSLPTNFDMLIVKKPVMRRVNPSNFSAGDMDTILGAETPKSLEEEKLADDNVDFTSININDATDIEHDTLDFDGDTEFD